MRVSVERLRLWILVLAVLLLASILLFFAYARWQVHRIARDLPGKLGISIQQSTNGFTFSKSEGNHTIFTLHAAKMVQYQGGGRAELHDVSITLYGTDGTPADYIYGNDFSYDPAGEVRANGEVQIDLQGPAGPAPRSANALADRSDGKNVVHVKTSDLVFNQKTGQASTPQRIEFRIAEAAGSATGASFDSRAGVLVLDSDVAFDSSVNGRPLVVHAGHAQYDRAGQVLHLFKAITDYMYSRGSSERASVYFRPDGSAHRVDAQGNVTVSNDGQKIVSQRARADLDQRSEPIQADLEGGLIYVADNAAHHLRGTAASGTVSFGPQASIRHAQLRNAVSIVDEEKALPVKHPAGKAPSSQSTTRDVQASQVDVDFARVSDQRTVIQNILAVGDAKLNIRTFLAGTAPQDTSVQGDRLLATLRDGVTLSTLRGAGHTKLIQLNPNGVKQSSSGDDLLMTFAPASGPAPAAAKGKSRNPASWQPAQLVSAEQQGNVTLIQQGQSNGKAPSELTATAQRATYDAATQLMKLSGDLRAGNPRVKDANGEVTAELIELERPTGNAIATGNVKATYRQSIAGPQTGGFNLGSSEPVHVVANHARFDHAKGLSIFYGEGREYARLWQGADSISAPVLELSLSRRTLFAHSANGSQGNAVKAVFTSVGKGARLRNAVPGPAQPGQAGQTSVVRVGSRTLIYSDAEDKAVFRGGVLAQNPSGTIRSDGMDVYLGMVGGTSPGGSALLPGPGSSPQAKPVKQVVRIVAQGNVLLEEPGRRATGDELTYTFQDGRCILTGSNSAPPRLVDQVHGTVTGASLIFNDRDDSVIVGGGQSKAVTETRTAK